MPDLQVQAGGGNDPGNTVIQPLTAGQRTEKLVTMVYICDQWGAPWTLVPYLVVEDLIFTCAPRIGAARFLWNYGRIRREDQDTSSLVEPVFDATDRVSDLSWKNKFVCVEVYRKDSQGQLQKVGRDWVGIIVNDQPRPFGQGDLREPAGDVYLIAKCLSVLLDDRIVDSSIQTYGAVGQFKMRYYEPLPFNLPGLELARPIGNRESFTLPNSTDVRLDEFNDSSTEHLDLGGYGGAASIFPFGDGAEIWSAAQAARYLVRLPNPPVLKFKIVDPANALGSLQDVWEVGGLTNFQALERVISRRRGLGFYIRVNGVVDNPGQPIDVVVFTASEADINVGNQSLPANQNTVNFTGLEADIQAGTPEASTDVEIAYDIIEVRGERFRIVGSFNFLDQSLNADWQEADELAYRKGYYALIEDNPVTITTFQHLSYETQLKMHDSARQSDRLQAVFTRFRFDGRYNDPIHEPRLGKGVGCININAPVGQRTRFDCGTIGVTSDPRTPWMPTCIDGALIDAQAGNAPSWPWAKGFDRRTPLVEGLDYSAAGMNPVSGDPTTQYVPQSGEPQYRAPFVLVGIDSGTVDANGEPIFYYFYAERLSDAVGHQSANVHIEDRGLAVSVVFAYRHYAAGQNYRWGIDEEIELVVNENGLEEMIEIRHFSGYNGTDPGQFGTLDVVDGDHLKWTPPGGGAGPSTLIEQGKPTVVPGADPLQHVVVFRAGTTPMTGSIDVYCPPFFNAEPGVGFKSAKCDWKNYILTASLTCDQRPFARARVHPAQDLPDNPRILRIYVKNAEVHWMHPNTVVDIGIGAQPIYAPAGPPGGVLPNVALGWRTIRSDADWIKKVAAFATAWYGRPRRSVKVPFNNIVWPADLGMLLRQIPGPFDSEGGEANTPITQVTLNLRDNTTLIETDYFEIAAEDAGKPYDAASRRRVKADITGPRS